MLIAQSFSVEVPKNFTAHIHKEGRWFVANCLETGTVSQGKTIEEAMENLKDATEGYLKVFPVKKLRFLSPLIKLVNK